MWCTDNDCLKISAKIINYKLPCDKNRHAQESLLMLITRPRSNIIQPQNQQKQGERLMRRRAGSKDWLEEAEPALYFASASQRTVMMVAIGRLFIFWRKYATNTSSYILFHVDSPVHIRLSACTPSSPRHPFLPFTHYTTSHITSWYSCLQYCEGFYSW